MTQHFTSVSEVTTLWRYTNTFIIIKVLLFLPPYSIPREWKNTLCNTKKYKNQAGMNLTPSPPSHNSHAVRWHCTAESERRVAEIKSWFLCRRPTEQQACEVATELRTEYATRRIDWTLWLNGNWLKDVMSLYVWIFIIIIIIIIDPRD